MTQRRHRIPVDTRSALRKLVDESGFTLQEMSEILGFSVSTVHTRICGVTRWRDEQEISRFREMLADRLGRDIARKEMFPAAEPARMR